MPDFHRLRHAAALAAVLMGLAAAYNVRAVTVTYEGVVYDQTDFQSLNLGTAGYWFPNFAATSPVEDRWTGENPRDALPPWAGPLNHVSIYPTDGDPVSNNFATFLTRTFSQDGPARSVGGQPGWNDFTLPDGEFGRSGAIVDPHTADGNSNNTINRIQLRGDVPETFYFSVITDNTNHEYDPEAQIRARGGAGETSPGFGDEDDISADPYPQAPDLAFNGIADVYTFKFTGFSGGSVINQTDFIKLRLGGGPAGGSFGGLLFDETFAPVTIPEPGAFGLWLAVAAGVGICRGLSGRRSGRPSRS